MSQLAPFYRRLRSLRRRRQTIRRMAAVFLGLAALLTALAIMFVLDVVFHLTIAQRLWVMACGVTGVAGCMWRWSWPWWAAHESNIDLALLVQKVHCLPDDLVASLEFDRDDDTSSLPGSASLRQAVVQHACWLNNQLNVFAVAQNTIAQRMWRAMLVALVFAALVFAVRPSYSRVFWQRLWLSSQQYPTRTQLDALWVNATRAALPIPDSVRVAAGTEVALTVYASGQVPEQGRVTLSSLRDGSHVDLVLHRDPMFTPSTRAAMATDLVARTRYERRAGDVSNAPLSLSQNEFKPAGVDGDWNDGLSEIEPDPNRDDNAASKNHELGRFSATLPRLREPVRFQLWLGDTYTEPADLLPMALPQVEAQLQITEPSYSGQPKPYDADGLNPLAQQGSTIDLSINSPNKRLRAATLLLWRLNSARSNRESFEAGASEGAVEIPLSTRRIAGGAKGETEIWRLDRATTRGVSRGVADPWWSLDANWRFEVRVVDVDGLSAEHTLSGSVRLVPDARPSIALQSIHPVVIASAKPVISYVAQDDVGISRIELHVQVHRPTQLHDTNDSPEGSVSADSSDANSATAAPVPITVLDQITLRDRMPIQGRYQLDLASYQLAVGDEIIVTPRVHDYRGDRPVESVDGPPLRWRITDQAGLLKSLASIDAQTERRLSEIIQRQVDAVQRSVEASLATPPAELSGARQRK